MQAFAPAVQGLLETGPREPARHELVPVWLDRLAQISWRTLVVLALLAVVSRAIVLPILSLPVIVAAILACVLRPIARRLRQRGAPGRRPRRHSRRLPASPSSSRSSA